MKSVISGRVVPAVLGSLLALLGGCAGYTPRVSVQDMPTLNDAYLYGRFFIDAPKSWLSMDGHQTMGFALECEDQGKYVVRFNRDDPVLAIKIKPSTCSWTEIIYSNADGQVRSRKPAPADTFKSIRFKGGYAYYLGDFAAELKTSMPSYNVIRTEWVIKSIKDNYEATTKDMRQAYPNLQALPDENRTITTAESDGPEGVEITDAQIRAEYERIAALQGDTEYRVRHILVSTKEWAKAAADSIKGGESFASVAKHMSSDPGSSTKGGDLGWNLPGNFTPAFADAMKALKPAGITTEPVQTEFGWHVIEVLETRPFAMPPYDEVKDRIAVRLRKKAKSGAVAKG